MAIAITRAASDRDIELARGLFRQYAAGLPFDLGYQNFAAELAALPVPYVPLGGCLLLAKRGTAALGTVGLKRLADGIAEIKRLYVIPEARGSGLGRLLLTRVIGEARNEGYAMRGSGSTAIVPACRRRSRCIGLWALAISRPTAPISAAPSRSSKSG